MISSLVLKILNIYKSFDSSFSIKNKSQKEANKIQLRVLKKLILKSKNTKFGIDHQFKKIKNYQEYIKNVPVRDYENIKNYIELIRKGKNDILWPKKPKYFAKTSGTTSGVKYIPITKESLKNQINSASYLLLSYLNEKKSLKAIGGKVMFISGSPNLDEKNKIKIGRLSGIVNYHEPLYLKNMILPSKQTNEIEDWEEKINKIVDETINEDLRILGGIPPWVQMYFDELTKRTGKKVIEIFPNLELLCHGGVNFGPYKKNLFDSIGKEIDTLETFPASEGFFAYQNSVKDDSLILQINSGIFYEFIDLKDLNKKNAKRITIGNVQINKNYALILSSDAGLWSYLIGDTVKFTSLNPLKIKVTGRTKQFISSFGEHVIVEEVEESLKRACKVFKETKIIEFTVGPRIKKIRGKSHHEWLIEFKNKPQNLDLFEKEIDLNLQSLNSYYKDLVQDGILSRLKIKIVKRKSFINFMKSKGKLGGQNKVPRLSNDEKLINEIIKFQ
jgi:hypothetical protein